MFCLRTHSYEIAKVGFECRFGLNSADLSPFAVQPVRTLVNVWRLEERRIDRSQVLSMSAQQKVTEEADLLTF